MDIELDNASRTKLIRLGQQFPKAGQAALDRLAWNTRTFISAEIRKTYNIKKTELDKHFTVNQATADNLRSIIRARSGGRYGGWIPLFGFRPSPLTVKRPQPGAGVRVAVKKGKKHLWRGSFIATMKSGHMGVFKMTGEKNAKGRPKIQELFSFRITQLFKSEHMKKKVQAFVHERLPVILKQQLRYFFSKAA